ncbi:MAG: hypothetical protein ISS45_04420 [Candidatus Omnitrophica bacterium]|nr:hypothetical protein [Candidatus Omnitrophota bacterium]
MIRKQVSSLIKILIICFTIVLFSSIQPCFAVFSLSVEPYEGGYDLRFGKVGTQDAKVIKEITIRVTTDIDKQYRVYQRLERSLTTPDGVEIDRNNFKMYTLINSNSKGTLERIEEFPVMSSDTVLYTSNTAGEGDSFRVVYTLQPSIDQVAGSYYGRMLYILMPIDDSAQDQVVKTLNMYADLTNEGAVDISTDSGFKSIRISSSDLDKVAPQYPSVFISVKGNLGARYRIYQRLGDSLIKASSGERFDLSKVTYKITDSSSGVIIKQGDLSDLRSKKIVYASDDLGSSNEIAIKFEPTKDFPQQHVNLFTGTINYYLELDRTTTILESGFIDSVDVEFDVEPIFKIVATSIVEGKATIQEGAALLRFGEVSYKTGAKESKVKIKVESNLEKPYLVTQKIMGPLQNEEGNRIPKEFFTFKLEKEEDTDATLKFDSETVIVPDKDMTLFVSNHNGDSDEFEITYRLRVTADTRGGDYSTGISYSLSEL